MKVRPNGVYDTMRTNGTDLYREIRPNASRKIQYKHEYKTPSVIPTTADIISTALREETKISRLGQHYNGVALYRCNRLAEYSTALYTRIIITITIITFYALWRYVNIVQAAIYYIYIQYIYTFPARLLVEQCFTNRPRKDGGTSQFTRQLQCIVTMLDRVCMS